MILTIAGGQSVTDYDGEALALLAHTCLTIGVNDSMLHWPCHIGVALDPDWILHFQAELRCAKIPVITRKWQALQGLGLDLIELDNRIPYRLSGMVACKLADVLAKASKTKHYCIGMDATAGHYYDDTSDCSKIVEHSDYEGMGLTHTTNLGVHSKISCWPKVSKLPKLHKAYSSPQFKAIGVAWLRGEARKIIK